MSGRSNSERPGKLLRQEPRRTRVTLNLAFRRLGVRLALFPRAGLGRPANPGRPERQHAGLKQTVQGPMLNLPRPSCGRARVYPSPRVLRLADWPADTGPGSQATRRGGHVEVRGGVQRVLC